MTDDNFPRFAWLHGPVGKQSILVNLTRITTAFRIGSYSSSEEVTRLLIAGEPDPFQVSETPEEIARMLGAAEIDNGR